MTPETLAKSNTEHAHQRAFFAWMNMAALFGAEAADDDRSYTVRGHAAAVYPLGGIGELAMAFAIPNGGKRDAITAAKLKGEGVKPGVPDIFLPLPRMRAVNAHGLFIEMKKPSEKPKKAGAGGVKVKQSEWHESLRAMGYAVTVCYSWREARNAVEAYYKTGLPE